MGLLNVTNTFVDGTVAKASEVNANFQDVEDVLNGNVDSDNLATDAVTTAKIKDDAVTADKIADDAVLTANIKDANVTSAKLATGAAAGNLDSGDVTTTMLADDAVTSAKIADDAVDTSQIADDAVTSAKIASGAVDTSQVADGAVTPSKTSFWHGGSAVYMGSCYENIDGDPAFSHNPGSWTITKEAAGRYVLTPDEDLGLLITTGGLRNWTAIACALPDLVSSPSEPRFASIVGDPGSPDTFTVYIYNSNGAATNAPEFDFIISVG